MINYLKRQERADLWVIRARFTEGDIVPDGTQHFTTEAQADAWISQHQKRHGSKDLAYARSSELAMSISLPN
jgi:hypothetical protein